MCDNHKNQRKGTNLKDKEAHKKDHNAWSRRSFIQNLGLTSGAGFVLGSYSLSAMNSPALLSTLAGGGDDDRILVMIRLKGGNDGLNTIIPLFDYGTYQRNRPSIQIPRSEIIDLNGEHGIPNSMQSIARLWNDGAMKVINTVGYDNHNLSHFNSSDIWNAANPDIDLDLDKSGWLGRYILNNDPDYLENLPDTPAAIKISSGSNIAFNNPDRIDLAVNFNTPERLLSIAETGNVYDTTNLPDDCYYGEQIGYIRSIMNVTYNYAPQISSAYSLGSNDVNYSNGNELARQLSIVARLIKGNLGTRLYMVTLDGFDTHENQNQNHPRLMRNLSEAVSAFYDDLASADMDNKVLSSTFSEFGRRIKENSGGTDHGTAAPVMMFGPCLDGNGIFGDNPDMDDIDTNGNLKHSVDFRSIYSTILECWLGLKAEKVDNILGAPFERLDIGMDCISISSEEIPISQNVGHRAILNPNGSTTIEYTLQRPDHVEVHIYSIMGQKLATIHTGYQLSGKHEALFINRMAGVSMAPLVYRIKVGRDVYAGKFVVSN